jgi:hypothetical protein
VVTVASYRRGNFPTRFKKKREKLFYMNLDGYKFYYKSIDLYQIYNFVVFSFEIIFVLK